METKKCTKCNEEKSLNEFHKDKTKNDKLGVWCKSCHKEYKTQNQKREKQRSKEYYSRPEVKEHKRQYCKKRNSRPEIKLYYKKYYREYYNQPKIKEKIKEQYKELYQTEEWKEYQRNWMNNKIKNDSNFKYKKLIRSLTYRVYKGEKDLSSEEILGCSFEKFLLYLEQQFLPEMNHSNHGEVWEIDHIIPLANFDLTKEEERRKAAHYTNLQPLFKTTAIAESLGYEGYIGNRNKSNKIAE